MPTPIQLYKDFIDGLVKLREGVLHRWVTERGWPDLPENKRINEVLASLTPQQKEVVADIVRQARRGGIHDVLAYLNDKIAIDDLRISQMGVEFPIEPFETLHYDWISRCEGDPWPDEQDT